MVTACNQTTTCGPPLEQLAGGQVPRFQQPPVIQQQLDVFYLVVSTHLKNISQHGNLPQVGVKIENIWNHHPVFVSLHLSPNTVFTRSNNSLVLSFSSFSTSAWKMAGWKTQMAGWKIIILNRIYIFIMVVYSLVGFDQLRFDDHPPI